MIGQRLYKAEWVHEGVTEELEEWEQELFDSGFQDQSEPQGWREYALEQWPDGPREGEHWPNGYKPFFWPATDRIFRSRSAAQRRVDIINRWGGKAEVVECTPVWESVAAANARRAEGRLQKRIDAKRAELDALVDKRDLARLWAQLT